MLVPGREGAVTIPPLAPCPSHCLCHSLCRGPGLGHSCQPCMLSCAAYMLSALWCPLPLLPREQQQELPRAIRGKPVSLAPSPSLWAHQSAASPGAGGCWLGQGCSPWQSQCGQQEGTPQGALKHTAVLSVCQEQDGSEGGFCCAHPSAAALPQGGLCPCVLGTGRLSLSHAQGGGVVSPEP